MAKKNKLKKKSNHTEDKTSEIMKEKAADVKLNTNVNDLSSIHNPQ